MGIHDLTTVRRVLVQTAVCWLIAHIARADSTQYERDIKPILKARCYACHGALKQEAGLRLDTGSHIRLGGDSGAAVVPNKPADSPLLARVLAQDEEVRMPPEGEPLAAAQIELLRAWITQGAKSPDSEQPEVDPRSHWAFQPPTRPAVPARAASIGERNPVDAFVEAELARQGLTPRPAASKHLLLRRVYLDLIGLPPTREELRAFLADESPDAFEQVVERLLSDPRHGERWGRHWMDIWRYSDWYGRRDANDVRNSASQIFRWRDWIVRSLNEGKGYDRMLQEMLAADEICPDDYDAGVATGYLIRNYYSLNPNDWMRSAVEHTGKAFLGLTFNCAHCHDHKYDPIEHDDYFRWRAFFEPISIRQDRVPGEADPGAFQDYTYAGIRNVQRLGAVRVFDKDPQAPTWFYTKGDERNRVKERGSIAPGVPAFLASTELRIEPVPLPPRAWYPGLRPEIQETVLAASRAAVSQAEADLEAVHKSGGAVPSATLDQLALAEAQLEAARAELASVEARISADRATFGEISGVDPTALAQIASRTERQAALRKAEAVALARKRDLAVAEAKPAGDPARGKEIDSATSGLTAARMAVAAANAALADESKAGSYSPLTPVYSRDSTGRRRALAHWITGRDNPLTARVAVNHIWTRHLHAPLVASMYDFGRNGARPSHPELLDWLAVEFMESGWNMQHLHRLIVTSTAYRRDSRVPLTAARRAPAELVQERAGSAGSAVNKDPENRFLWRMNASRMESEVVRDSLLYAAGRLDLTMGGVELENNVALTTNRRSLYYSVYPESGGKSALGELFDAPDPLDCYRRVSTIVPQQALALTNSELVHQSSVAIVKAWQESRPDANEATPHDAAPSFITAMFEQILSRAPTEAELRVCREVLERQQALAAQVDVAQAVTQARESLVRILLNHNDFVTVR